MKKLFCFLIGHKLDGRHYTTMRADMTKRIVAETYCSRCAKILYRT